MKVKSLLISILLVASLLYTIVDYIYLQHKTRNKFIELQTLLEHEHNLNANWGRLQIAQSTLVNNSRIEKETKAQLGMKLPQNEQIISIKR